MAIEKTLSIIKPDAVAKNVIGEIYSRFEKAGLKVIAARMTHLSRAEAEGFYAVHKARPFFNDLVSFMISGPVMIQVLEGEGAILKNRDRLQVAVYRRVRDEITVPPIRSTVIATARTRLANQASDKAH